MTTHDEWPEGDGWGGPTPGAPPPDGSAAGGTTAGRSVSDGSGWEPDDADDWSTAADRIHTPPAASAHPPPVPTPSPAVLDAPGGIVRPPLALLVAGVVLPLLTAPLLPLRAPGFHVLGWALAVFGSLGFLLAFTAADLRSSTNPRYAATVGPVPVLRIVVLAVGLGLAAAHAWAFADWASRLDVFAG